MTCSVEKPLPRLVTLVNDSVRVLSATAASEVVDNEEDISVEQSPGYIDKKTFTLGRPTFELKKRQ